MIRALAALLAVPLLLGAAPPPGGITVVVTVSELRSHKGLIQGCMVRSADDFPDCTDAGNTYTATVSASTEQVRFANVTPGRYAIALLHDENGNGKADRMLGMMPKEGFGFSHDAPLRMGPPKFSAAAFTVDDEPLQMAIRMRYLF